MHLSKTKVLSFFIIGLFMGSGINPLVSDTIENNYNNNEMNRFSSEMIFDTDFQIPRNDENNKNKLSMMNNRLPIYTTDIVDDNPDYEKKMITMAIDSKGYPHICYYAYECPQVLPEVNNLTYANWTGTNWNIVTIEEDVWDIYEISLALDSNDHPTIVYYDGRLGYDIWDLKRASYYNGDWHKDYIASWPPWQGRYHSLAIDSNDNQHICWSGNQSNTPYSIKTLKYTGPFGSLEFDRTAIFGLTWTDCDLALDSKGNPHICYYDNGYKQIKYIYYNGTQWQPADNSPFPVWIVDPIIIDSNCANFVKMALDSNDNPHILYEKLEGPGDDYRYCIFDGKTKQYIETPSKWTSVFNQIDDFVLDSYDLPHFAYHEKTPGSKITHGYYDGVEWQEYKVVESSQNDIFGHECAIALDDNDNPHIAYQSDCNPQGDSHCYQLNYARGFGANWNWYGRETLNENIFGGIAFYPSSCVDAVGTQHVVWSEQSNSCGSGSDVDIFYQRKPVQGSWSDVELVSLGSYNFSYSPSVDVQCDGTVHVVWQEYDELHEKSEIRYKYKSFDQSWWPIHEKVISYTYYNGLPSIFVDSDGTAHVTWDHSSYGEPTDVLYNYKNSGGSWGDEEIVSVGCSQESGASKVVVDKDDTVHVVWTDNSTGSNPTEYDVLYNYKPSGGSFGSYSVLTDFFTVWSGYPSLCVDGNGTLHLTWIDFADIYDCGSDMDIFYSSKPSGSSWSYVEVVSTESDDESYLNSVCVDKRGIVHVSWMDYTDYGGCGTDCDIFYKRKTQDYGWTLTDVVTTESIYSISGFCMCVDYFDTIHIIWSDYHGFPHENWDLHYKYRRGGRYWTDLIDVSDSTNACSEPSVFVDNRDRVHVVWKEIDGGVENICYRFQDFRGGNWNGIHQVSNPNGIEIHTRNPSVYVDNKGKTHFVWEDISDSPGIPDGNVDIFYRSVDYSKQYPYQWSDIEVVSTTSTLDAWNPAICVDNDGTVHVLWEDGTDVGSGSDRDIFYSSKFVGGDWNTPELISTGSTDFSMNPTICIDKDDTIHIAWRDNSDLGGPSDIYSDIYYRYKPSSGSWSSIEPVSVEPDTNALKPSITVDKDKTVHFVWSLFDNWIMYRYKTNDGTWNDVENINTESTFHLSRSPKVRADEDGNVHVVWMDADDYYGSDMIDWDIFYKYKTGDHGWTCTEVLSINSPDNYHSWNPSISVDNYGLPHIAWSEFDYPTGLNIYYLSQMKGSLLQPRFSMNSYIWLINQILLLNEWGMFTMWWVTDRATRSGRYDVNDSIVSYLWDFGDGTYGDDEVVYHTYTEVGDYTVTCTVEDINGATYTFSKVFTVYNEGLNADFTWDPMTPTRLDLISFNDTSLHTDQNFSIVNWTWDFDDGHFSYLQHPSHQFSTLGNYSVNLTVRDNNGGTHSLEEIVHVVNDKPFANATCEPSNPTTYQTIYFNSTSVDYDGSIVNWTWSMEDGTILYGEQVTHQYSDNLPYDVVLTVQDNNDANDTFGMCLRVRNQPPTADFTWDPLNPIIQDTVQFTDTSTDNDGTIVNWSWDFDDGNTSTDQNPTYQYTVDGDYNVCLTVEDDDGVSDEVYKTVSVLPLNQPPIADFTYTPLLPDVDETITFTDESMDIDGSLTDWFWDFDDGNTSTDQHPTHSYTSSGRYHVTLTVTDDEGASDSHSKLIPVGLDLMHLQNVSDGWNLVSVPFNQTLNKDDFLVKHDGYFYSLSDGLVSEFLFGWDRAGQYYTFADTLNPGYGYWLYSHEDCELWIESLTPVFDEYITTIESNWNLVSVPFDQPVDKVDLLVDDETWTYAVGEGWLSDFVFGWNRAGQYYDFADTFTPGQAYWLYSYQQCVLKRNI